jgi:hypothetical protein
MSSHGDNGGDKLLEGERARLELVKKDFAPTEEAHKFCKEA